MIHQIRQCGLKLQRAGIDTINKSKSGHVKGCWPMTAV